MFRIKNVRNATVGKPPNIPTPGRNVLPPPPPPQAPQNKPGPAVKPIAQTAIRALPTRQLVRRNEGSKPKPAIVQSKGINLRPSGPIARKAAEPQTAAKNVPKEEEKPDRMVQVVRVEKMEDKKGAQTTAVQPARKQPCQHINKHSPMIHTEQAPSQRHIPHPPFQQPQLGNRQESIKKEEEDREARLREERRLRKERQEEQQRKNASKLQEMMEKVNARRKAREQEKERRMKFQQQIERQRNEVGGGVGGMVALSDPLAHVEMSQAVMDAQIKMVLGMKLAGYPNQAALQQQVDQLQRINRSYLLVRADPNNPLIKGLANFRIQLFNRVGELIMQGQKQMGPSAAGLRVIQADSRHYPQIKGVAVTRGMQGHLSMLRKRALLQEEECAICLGGVSAGQRVYDVACGHIFHEQCLQEWLNSNANCPACRYNIKFGHTE